MTPPLHQVSHYACDVQGNPVRYKFPWARDGTEWERVCDVLSRAIDNMDSIGTDQGLYDLISRVQKRVDYTPGDHVYTALGAAIAGLGRDLPGFAFFSNVLPHIVQTALSAPKHLPDDCAVLFKDRYTSTVQFTHHQVYVLSCLAFFGLLRPLHEQYESIEHRRAVENGFGSIDWLPLYQQRSSRGESVGVARIKCQIAYLWVQMQRDVSHESSSYVKFYRKSLLRTARSSPLDIDTDTQTLRGVPSWATSTRRLSSLKLDVSSATKIEDQPADAHVDFANKYLHIGQIIPSATQEEVLFSIRPECFIGLLFSEEMKAGDVIVISGARRYCNYTGYLNTFQFAGVCDDVSAQAPDVVAMDAIINRGNMQFEPRYIDRDLNKAYLAFTIPSKVKDQQQGASSTEGDQKGYASVSTGKWGCGAFGGDPVLKFVQQVLAAAQAGVGTMYYSTFGQPDLARQHLALWEQMIARDIKVGDLYLHLIGFLDKSGVAVHTDPWSGGHHSSHALFEVSLREFLGL